ERVQPICKQKHRIRYQRTGQGDGGGGSGPAGATHRDGIGVERTAGNLHTAKRSCSLDAGPRGRAQTTAPKTWKEGGPANGRLREFGRYVVPLDSQAAAPWCDVRRSL